MKTVRFSQVVARSGEPHVHTLWLAPEKDAEFSRARKTDRVMTVQRGAGAEFGTIGYEAGQQYLVFPKPLKRFAGKRVVGLKFDLIEQPKAVPASIGPPRPKSHSTHRAAGPGRAGRRGKPPSRRSPEPQTTKAVAHADRGHTQVAGVEPQRHEPDVALPDQTPPARHTPGASNDADALRREIRAALKELKAGKAVAAYQRLERAVEK